MDELDRHSLIDTFLTRRSRRFALGSHLHGSALAFESQSPPVPLSLDEEAILAFAASGVTGQVNGELPYSPDAGPETGGGQIMMSTVGRTQSSADAVATVDAVHDQRRGDVSPAAAAGPSDPASYEALVALGRERSLHRDVSSGCGSRCATAASEIPRELPFTPPFNKWSANIPGATYFVPVTEVTGAVPDDPVRGAGRGVRLLLPRRQGLR